MTITKDELRDMAQKYADEIGEDVIFYPQEPVDYDYMKRSAFEKNGYEIGENDEVISPTR